MDYFDLVKKRRSVRSFSQEPVSVELLQKLTDAARVGPSGANKQPLEYAAVTDPAMCKEVFDCLKWAAHTAPLGTPGPGHEPTAYIIILVREEHLIPIGAQYDVGAAAQTIMLGAEKSGLGTCWLKSINYPRLTKILGLPQGVVVDSVIAMGVRGEEPTQVDLEAGKKEPDMTNYWRDDAGEQFVPKRALADIWHLNGYGKA